MLQTILCTAVPASPHGDGSAVFTRPATAPAVAVYTQDLTAIRQLAALREIHFSVDNRTDVEAYVHEAEGLKG